MTNCIFILHSVTLGSPTLYVYVMPETDFLIDKKSCMRKVRTFITYLETMVTRNMENGIKVFPYLIKKETELTSPFSPLAYVYT